MPYQPSRPGASDSISSPVIVGTIPSILYCGCTGRPTCVRSPSDGALLLGSRQLLLLPQSSTPAGTERPPGSVLARLHVVLELDLAGRRVPRDAVVQRDLGLGRRSTVEQHVETRVVVCRRRDGLVELGDYVDEAPAVAQALQFLAALEELQHPAALHLAEPEPAVPVGGAFDRQALQGGARPVERGHARGPERAVGEHRVVADLVLDGLARAE